MLPSPEAGRDAERVAELAEAFGSGYIMRRDKEMYVRDGILSVEATRRGVPAFTFEIGEGGRLEPELVDVGVRCVFNALRHLKMLPGTVERPPRTVRMREFVPLRSSRGGLLFTEARPGAMVRKGDLLARVTSIWGDEVERFPVPVDGLFVRSTTLSTVAAGERVATVGVVL